MFAKLTVTNAEGNTPQPPLGERVHFALDALAEPDLAGIIAASGLAAVYEELERARATIRAAADQPLEALRQVALITDEARRWKRRHGGAVAQARHEHDRAEALARQVARLKAELDAAPAPLPGDRCRRCSHRRDAHSSACRHQIATTTCPCTAWQEPVATCAACHHLAPWHIGTTERPCTQHACGCTDLATN